jgi:hypothetical protein
LNKIAALVVAAALALSGGWGFTASSAHAQPACQGGLGGFLSEINPEFAQTFGPGNNMTKNTGWPGASANCSPNDAWQNNNATE